MLSGPAASASQECARTRKMQLPAPSPDWLSRAVGENLDHKPWVEAGVGARCPLRALVRVDKVWLPHFLSVTPARSASVPPSVKWSHVCAASRSLRGVKELRGAGVPQACRLPSLPCSPPRGCLAGCWPPKMSTPQHLSPVNRSSCGSRGSCSRSREGSWDGKSPWLI